MVTPDLLGENKTIVKDAYGANYWQALVATGKMDG
jgi:hypothetical protein